MPVLRRGTYADLNLYFLSNLSAINDGLLGIARFPWTNDSTDGCPKRDCVFERDGCLIDLSTLPGYRESQISNIPTNRTDLMLGESPGRGGRPTYPFPGTPPEDQNDETTTSIYNIRTMTFSNTPRPPRKRGLFGIDWPWDDDDDDNDHHHHHHHHDDDDWSIIIERPTSTTSFKPTPARIEARSGWGDPNNVPTKSYTEALWWVDGPDGEPSVSTWHPYHTTTTSSTSLVQAQTLNPASSQITPEPLIDPLLNAGDALRWPRLPPAKSKEPEVRANEDHGDDDTTTSETATYDDGDFLRPPKTIVLTPIRPKPTPQKLEARAISSRPTATHNPHPHDGGKAAVHEVGHWLGLLHVFTEGQNGSDDEGNCDGDGDGVDDTPIQKTRSYGCQVGKDSCPNQEGTDSVHNYMDYGDDKWYVL